jgi:phosphoglucomutase
MTSLHWLFRSSIFQRNPRQTIFAASELAGERIEAVLATAPGDGDPIGGIEVITRNGWFAALPSGAQNVYRSTPRVFGIELA